MRAIYILAEGPTEEIFINKIVAKYFYDKGIYDVRAFLMPTSKGNKGGAVSYQRFKRNVENLLKNERDVIVTSLIDYFRLYTDFPDYEKTIPINNKMQRVAALENALSSVINNRRFIPYIQLHEFEGLLFSSSIGFENFPDVSVKNLEMLRQAVKEHDNPELLNDGAETAPSKRLEKLLPSYKKTIHGTQIAEEISLLVIMQKCERFRNWIETLTQRMQA
jgi:hypothetical protein